jgi:hypothetical protein
MVASIPRYEVGDTRMFTVVYSTAPTTPVFTVRQGSGEGVLIESKTATASSTSMFFAYHTMVDCQQVYTYQWVASYTGGPVVDRGYFKVIKSIPG